MKYRQKLSAIVVLLLFFTISTAFAQTTLPAEDIAEKALAATVYLEMKDNNGKTLGIGSGFFVKPNLIATNYHVIEGAAKGTAKLVGKYTTYNIEGVTGTDKTNDLALLKVTSYGIKPLYLGNSDIVKIGETVYVAGNPKGLEGTFSDGIISSRRDKYTKERLQMTAPISPGSNGGPVVNNKGEVIGVSFITLQGLQNLNLIIPSNYLKKLLNQPYTSKNLDQGSDFISAETYFNWGNTKFVLRDYENAITDYTEGIRLKSIDANFYCNRGIAKGKLGQYNSAIIDFNIATQLKPDFSDAFYMRGLVNVKLTQYSAAVEDFDMAIGLKPDMAQYYIDRGAAKHHLGQYLAAIADNDTAIRLKPDNSFAFYNRGAAKIQLKQYDAAIADFNTAIRLKSDFAEAFYNRGIAKIELELYTAAIADFDTTIRLKPDFADAYYNRGITKGKLGQHADAIADFDTTIRLKPDFADAYYNRGLAKGKLGQYTAAISDFDIAIRLNPDNADAYYDRGLAKAGLGRTSAAKQDIRTALRLAIKAGDVELKTDAEEALRILNK